MLFNFVVSSGVMVAVAAKQMGASRQTSALCSLRGQHRAALGLRSVEKGAARKINSDSRSTLGSSIARVSCSLSDSIVLGALLSCAYLPASSPALPAALDLNWPHPFVSSNGTSVSGTEIDLIYLFEWRTE